MCLSCPEKQLSVLATPQLRAAKAIPITSHLVILTVVLIDKPFRILASHGVPANVDLPIYHGHHKLRWQWVHACKFAPLIPNVTRLTHGTRSS